MKRRKGYQVFLLGNEGVGKLSIANRFAGYEFGCQHFDPTDDFDFSKRLNLSFSSRKKGEWEPRVDLIHAPGSQEKNVALLLSLGRFFTDGALIIYSVTSRQSFLNAKSYTDQVSEASNQVGMPPWTLYLVGNKINCARSDREVSTREGKELAASLKLGFTEVSAKAGKNVDEAFRGLVREMMKREPQLVEREVASNLGEWNGAFRRLKETFRKWWA